MSKLKIYSVSGFFLKNRRKIPITLDIRGLKIEDALDRYYSLVGSKHYVSRKDIFVKKPAGIKIISKEDSKNKDFIELDEPGFSMPTKTR